MCSLTPLDQGVLEITNPQTRAKSRYFGDSLILKDLPHLKPGSHRIISPWWNIAMLDEATEILMKKCNTQQQTEIPSHLLGEKLHFVNPIHPSVKKNDTIALHTSHDIATCGDAMMMVSLEPQMVYKMFQFKRLGTQKRSRLVFCHWHTTWQNSTLHSFIVLTPFLNPCSPWAHFALKQQRRKEEIVY